MQPALKDFSVFCFWVYLEYLLLRCSLLSQVCEVAFSLSGLSSQTAEVSCCEDAILPAGRLWQSGIPVYAQLAALPAVVWQLLQLIYT